MKRCVVFVTGLTLWSMGKGYGGPAFSKTVEKYVNEGNEVYLISNVDDNQNYNGIDAKHNIYIKPSFAHKYCGIRKLGLVARWLDHKITSRKFIKAISLVLCAKDDAILYAYEIDGVDACKKYANVHHNILVTRFQGTILAEYRKNLANIIMRYPHFQALETEADLVIMTDDGTQGNLVLDELENNSNRLFLRNGLDLVDKIDEYAKISKEEVRSRLGIYPKDKEMVFLSVSRLVNWKKVDRTIAGFADYISLGNKGVLYIVGDGEEKQNLINLSAKLGVKDYVHFVGAVKHDDVYNYMLSCDIFVSMYDLSNVGNPLLEAMTLGRCAVTLDVGDTGEVIKNRENGIIIKKEELKNLGAIFAELANDKTLCKTLGDGAREYARTNLRSWETRMDIEYNTVMDLKIENKA